MLQTPCFPGFFENDVLKKFDFVRPGRGEAKFYKFLATLLYFYAIRTIKKTIGNIKYER